MSAELNIPDLPEVRIAVPPLAPRATPGAAPRVPWHRRAGEALANFMPLLVMVALALASWWLVRHAPGPVGAAPERPVSAEPDYTLQKFAVERFDAAGRLKLRIVGETMRHYPGADRFEVDAAQIRYVAPDGRVTLATARRAEGTGDGSELLLLGGAEVLATDASGSPIVMRGEFLHAFLVTERISSHLPVFVQARGSTLRAAGLEYDHVQARLELKGPLRAELPPRVPR